MYHYIISPNTWKSSTVLQHRTNIATLFIIGWCHKNRDRLTFKPIPSNLFFLILFIAWRTIWVDAHTVLVIVKNAVSTICKFYFVLILILFHSFLFSPTALVTLSIEHLDKYHTSNYIHFLSYTLPLLLDTEGIPNVDTFYRNQ